LTLFLVPVIYALADRFLVRARHVRSAPAPAISARGEI
jgi:hypothetical protein